MSAGQYLGQRRRHATKVERLHQRTRVSLLASADRAHEPPQLPLHSPPLLRGLPLADPTDDNVRDAVDYVCARLASI